MDTVGMESLLRALETVSDAHPGSSGIRTCYRNICSRFCPFRSGISWHGHCHYQKSDQ